MPRGIRQIGRLVVLDAECLGLAIHAVHLLPAAGRPLVAPVRIDILNEIDGVTFADCYAACEPSTWDGIVVNFISLADLRKNKASTGRHKDAADLRNLNKVKRK